MSFLIDTNVISEIRKEPNCDPAVAAWWSNVAEDDFWLSALVLGEIRKGVELERRRDPPKAALEAGLGAVTSGFGNRVLVVDASVAKEWGRISPPFALCRPSTLFWPQQRRPTALSW